jgi:hypothetical protein
LIFILSVKICIYLWANKKQSGLSQDMAQKWRIPQKQKGAMKFFITP